MQKFITVFKKEIFPISLIFILALSRLIPHPWNFTPVLAIGVFSGFYFKQIYLGFFLVIFSMFIGDLFLGFHSTMFFTYISLIAAVLIGSYVKLLSNILYCNPLSKLFLFFKSFNSFFFDCLSNKTNMLFH